MTGRTHDLAAISSLGIVVLISGLEGVGLSTVIVALFANMVGGIMPDVDQPTAPFWRNLPVGKYFGRIFAMLNGGHRFLTHSILGLAIFGFLAHWLLVFIHPIMSNVDIDLVWWAFMIGMISHLVMDTFTREGVPWLLPIPFKFGLPPIKAWRIRTGEFAETWIVFPLIVLLDLGLLLVYSDQVVAMLHSWGY